MLEAFLAPSPVAGEGRGEGDGGTTDGLVHRLWPNESPLSLPSPARGEGELSLDLPGLYGSFNGIGVSPWDEARFHRPSVSPNGAAVARSLPPRWGL